MKPIDSIVIICAMEEELTSIITSLNLAIEIKQDNNFTMQLANLKQYQLILLLSGIGKVNAAMCTQYVIDKFAPKYIINVGVAGGLSNDLTFGDVVVADDLVQYDMDVTAFNMPLGQIPRLDTFSFASDTTLLAHVNNLKPDNYTINVGRIISGDQFIDDQEKAKQLHVQFKALACEMEGAAVAQVCYLNKVPFIVVRALSDMAGQSDSHKDAAQIYKELKDMVAHRSAIVVSQILMQIIES